MIRPPFRLAAKFIDMESTAYPKSVEDLLEWVASIAKSFTGGHYTILRFTTNYRGFYGTPSDNIREELDDSLAFSTLRELLVAMITNPDKFNIYGKG